MDVVIELALRRQDFKDLYYTKKDETIFRWRGTKIILASLVILILFTVAIYYLSFENPMLSWALFVFPIGLVIIIFWAYSNARIYYKWKIPIERYLKELPVNDSCKLVLGNNIFEFIQPNQSVIQKWADIKTMNFLPGYISMITQTGERYLFPAASMTADDFQILGNFIRNKMKDETLPDEVKEKVPDTIPHQKEK
jgi:hypothetical protein